MNWLDWAIVALAALSAFGGLRQGAIRQVCNFAGLILGIFLAGRWHHGFANAVFAGQSWGQIAAYIIIVVLIGAIALGIGWGVARVVSNVMLGWVDRLVGGLVGFFVGLISCAALVAIVAQYVPPARETIAQSGLSRLLLTYFPLVLGLLPDEFGFIKNLFVSSAAATT